MKFIQQFVKYFLLLPLLIIQFSCSDDPTSTSTPGLLEGTWTLSALTGTYVRDVAQPTGTTTTSYDVTVSWDDALAVLGSATAADQTIATFDVGDNVLTKTSELADPDALAASYIGMTGTFNSQDVYTLVGTYPTLRLNEVGDANYTATDPGTGLPLADCETYQTVAAITDQGYYGVAYDDDDTGGTLTVTPDASLGDQVLPPFDDATLTFTNAGETVNIQFTDRDSHDTRYTEVMDADAWTEDDNRVTMGVAVAGVDADGAFAATGAVGTAKSGYLKNEALVYWGGYVTFYYFAIAYEATVLNAAGLIADTEISSAIYYMTVNNSNTGAMSIPYSVLVSSAGVPANDSATDFSTSNAAAGGKMTYTINPVCIPVNEIIEFDATFDKAAD